ncbi:hypothetical protein SKAU_G00054060 [Synaphobranchus kaupii]|uniref:Uncharacterized protein n=1 Tax=Synaphobranchus kaupii TaxID=118154 RepID=A0A9Q1G4G7_SYNKA|nr:hypothetical protein SKAU_G00054060 [Synaphobranchus kaupii]
MTSSSAEQRLRGENNPLQTADGPAKPIQSLRASGAHEGQRWHFGAFGGTAKTRFARGSGPCEPAAPKPADGKHRARQQTAEEGGGGGEVSEKGNEGKERRSKAKRVGGERGTGGCVRRCVVRAPPFVWDALLMLAGGERGGVGWGGCSGVSDQRVRGLQRAPRRFIDSVTGPQDMLPQEEWRQSALGGGGRAGSRDRVREEKGLTSAHEELKKPRCPPRPTSRQLQAQAVLPTTKQNKAAFLLHTTSLALRAAGVRRLTTARSLARRRESGVPCRLRHAAEPVPGMRDKSRRQAFPWARPAPQRNGYWPQCSDGEARYTGGVCDARRVRSLNHGCQRRAPPASAVTRPRRPRAATGGDVGGDLAQPPSLPSAEPLREKVVSGQGGGRGEKSLKAYEPVDKDTRKLHCAETAESPESATSID